jgi:excisionase family DNA binding protein
MSIEHQPITVGEAARILRVSEDTVRRYDAAGVLKAARTSSGVRIFDRRDVERVAADRDRRR